jgi:hypothetical protein
VPFFSITLICSYRTRILCKKYKYCVPQKTCTSTATTAGANHHFFFSQSPQQGKPFHPFVLHHRMNPSSPDTSSMNASSHQGDTVSSRLEADATLNTEDYPLCSKRRRRSNESCDSDTPLKRLPSTMIPTKEVCSGKKEAMSSPPNRCTSLMTLIGLVHARRSSNPQKTAELQAATNSLSLESASRRSRIPRRHTCMGDMRLASQASQLLNSALAYPDTSAADAGATQEEAAALGYGDTEEPPPSKRRRHQRRNSFVIPETSRSTGQTSGFSWRAMDFLYGLPPGTAASQEGCAKLAMPSVLAARRESIPPVASTAD